MPSPQFVTLFAQSAEPSRSKGYFLVSALLHGAGIAGLFMGILDNPRIVRPLAPAYSIQIVHMKAPQAKPTTDDQAHDDLASPFLRAQPVSGPPSGTNSSSFPARRKSPVKQILLQDNAPIIEIKEAFVPSLLILSPKAIIDVRHIVPQLPTVEARTRTHPVEELPADTPNLDDVQIASSPFHTEKLNIPASATTPLVTSATLQSRAPAQTRSDPGPEPTSARILSLSDLQLTSGAFIVPHMATASTRSAAPLLVETENLSKASGAPRANAFETAHDAAQSASPTDPPNTRRINLPKDGKFAMVLVGDSVAESYPEAASTWRGRLAYTVYLHVGLTRNWILQYSLPRPAQANGSGASGRLESPWPISIVVPHLDDFSSEAEAVIVHGFLNADGSFEQLAVDFPPQFSRTAFVLDSLKPWVFRPATLNGQPATIEVLLIIPTQDQ